MFHLDPKQAVLDHVAQPVKRAAPGTINDLAAMVADQPYDHTYSASVTAGVAQAIEIALLTLTGFVVFGINGGGVLTTLALVAGAEGIINRLGMHGIAAYRLGFQQFARVAAAWTAAFAVLGVLVLLFDQSGALSRPWIAAFWAIGLGVLLSWRAALHLLVTRWTKAGNFRRRTVIVGGGKDAESLIASIETQAKDDIKLIGLFDDRDRKSVV